MSRYSRRPLVVLALLALALLGVVAIYARPAALIRGALRASVGQNDHAFMADIDRWRRTNRERQVQARYDFSLSGDLAALPLQVGNWQGVDLPQTNLEVMILLEPEQYVYRRYTRSDGKFVWLSLIASRQAKSFHSPQICYDADGWQTDVTSEPVELDEGSLYALRLDAHKDPWEHVVLYFFLYPDRLRDANSGTVLFKVTAPLEGSLADTLALQKSFIREFFHSASL